MKANAFILPGRIGDALFATATVRALAKSDAPTLIDWVYDAEYRQFFEWLATTDLPVRCYIGIKDPAEQSHLIFRRDWGLRSTYGWLKHLPAHNGIYNATLTRLTPRTSHIAKTIARRCGLDEKVTLDFHLTTKESVTNGGYLLVHSGASDPARHVPELLSIAWPKGTRATTYRDEPVPDNVERVACPLFTDLVWQVAHAGAVVGTSSSVTVLAAMLGKPTLCVHREGVTDQSAGVSIIGPHAVDVLGGYDAKQIHQLVVDFHSAHCNHRAELIVA